MTRLIIWPQGLSECRPHFNIGNSVWNMAWIHLTLWVVWIEGFTLKIYCTNQVEYCNIEGGCVMVLVESIWNSRGYILFIWHIGLKTITNTDTPIRCNQWASSATSTMVSPWKICMYHFGQNVSELGFVYPEARCNGSWS